MLSLVASSLAFGGNAAPRMASRAAVSMSAITPGDVGTTKPLGVWDPLNLIQNDAVKYRRWQEMEIKHGRIAMLAFLHVVVTGAGYRCVSWIPTKWFAICSPRLRF